MLRHADILPPGSLYSSPLHVFIINKTLEFPFKPKRLYLVKCFNSIHVSDMYRKAWFTIAGRSWPFIHIHGQTWICLTKLSHVVAWHEIFQSSAYNLKYRSHNWTFFFYHFLSQKKNQLTADVMKDKNIFFITAFIWSFTFDGYS